MDTEKNLQQLVEQLTHKAEEQNRLQHLLPPRPEQQSLPDPKARSYEAASLLLIQDNSTFINIAYQCLLKRTADPQGYSNYQQALQQGLTRPELLAQLSLSPEGKQQNVIISGIDYFLKQEERSQQHPKIYRWLKRLLRPINKHLARKQQKAAQSRAATICLQQQINWLAQQTTQQLQKLQQQQQHQQSELRALATTPLHQPQKQTTQPTAVSVNFSHFYLAFENAFRGNPEQIRQKQQSYLQYLPPPTKKPLVDLGCGRGEWLQLAKEQGYTCLGLDNNEAMLAECRSQGIQVKNQPLTTWLAAQPAESLLGVSAFHLVEHLPFQELLDIAWLSYQALQPGGVILLETPNAKTPSVSNYSFYHDPTHRNPLTAELLEFILKYCGFINIQQLQLGYTEPDPTQNSQPQDLGIVAYKPETNNRQPKTS